MQASKLKKYPTQASVVTEKYAKNIVNVNKYKQKLRLYNKKIDFTKQMRSIEKSNRSRKSGKCDV